MSEKSKEKTRIMLDIEEIQAIRSLVEDRLRGKEIVFIRKEILGDLLIKTGRARKRVQPLG